MTQKHLMKLADHFPDILIAESEVPGIHYLYDSCGDKIAVAPSGRALALTREGPVLRLTVQQARTLCEELLGLAEVMGG